MPVNDPHSIAQQIELLGSLTDAVKENLSLLLPVDQAWQPTDFLPDLQSDNWREEIAKFRDPSQQLSDEVLVVLVGDMITEEALPNYAVSLNLIARDPTGTSKEPWAKWMRGWVSEENRHGDLLNAYLRLTGRVDMRAVEVTVHNLINNGFNPRTGSDLYSGLIYTSFQERATKISHARVGKLAEKQGDANLAKICKKIAADESRHEAFYTRMMGEVMKRDAERGVILFRNLMRRVIAMPGKLMDDGQDPDLFEHFSAVAQRMDVYTARDYADILEHLVKTWDVASLSVTGEAAEAQQMLCSQAEKIHDMADAVTESVAKKPIVPFSWIHGRSA